MYEKTFGKYLHEKRSNINGSSFAKSIGISYVYLLDIERGARSVPKKELQIKMADYLKLNDEDRIYFFDLAAKEKNDVPADIWDYITGNDTLIGKIRSEIVNKEKETSQEKIK